jgi:hypothetical protein
MRLTENESRRFGMKFEALVVVSPKLQKQSALKFVGRTIQWPLAIGNDPTCEAKWDYNKVFLCFEVEQSREAEDLIPMIES